MKYTKEVSIDAIRFSHGIGPVIQFLIDKKITFQITNDSNGYGLTVNDKFYTNVANGSYLIVEGENVSIVSDEEFAVMGFRVKENLQEKFPGLK